MRKLLTRFLGSPTVRRLPVKQEDAGSTPAPGAEEYVQAEVCSPAEVLLTTGHWDPAANVANRPKTAEENRAMMQAARQVDIDRNRTAYPMRGRFHCCDPKIIDVHHADTGLWETACLCELCGWEFNRQAYVPHPNALPADTTPPPLSADCNEPGGSRMLPK